MWHSYKPITLILGAFVYFYYIVSNELKHGVGNSNTIPFSERMYPILGLNLLRLLAQNRIADFHTQLETIDPEQIHTNAYIRHPVQIEQCLMEGSYNKVWHARKDVP